MNWYKKELTSAFVTLGLFFLGVAIWSGEYLSLAKTLGSAFLVFGSIWLVWRGTYKILDKAFPEKSNTQTLGALKTHIVSYKFDETKF